MSHATIFENSKNVKFNKGTHSFRRGQSELGIFVSKKLAFCVVAHSAVCATQYTVNTARLTLRIWPLQFFIRLSLNKYRTTPRATQ
jgi:hypothetical protein